MSRINTNVSSLTAQHSLLRSQSGLQTALTRLSTGLRINTGKDDPAGLIASEVLRSEIVSIRESIGNTERANNFIATADAALGEVSTLLTDIRGLVQTSANKGAVSTAEIAANQTELDSILDSIDRIGQSTVFGGDKLLNGTKSFTVGLQSGTLAPFASTADIRITAYNPALTVSGADVTINVTTIATKKTNVVDGTTLATLSGTGTDTVTIQVTGDLGTSVVSFNAAAAVADSVVLTNAVNSVTSSTGVTAAGSGAGGNVTLTSSNYGANSEATLTALAATVVGDIAKVNTAVSTGATTAGVNTVGTVTHALGGGSLVANSKNGEVVTYTDANITLSATTDPTLGTSSAALDVSGGALFQIGPQVNYQNQVNVNLPNLSAALLGRNNTTTGNKALGDLRSGGSDELASTSLLDATKLIDQSINEIATLRGQLGSLQKNVFETNIRSLQSTLEQVVSAESSIRDADFAAETASLTRSQILVQAGTSVLALANQSPQNVLALLQ